MTLLKRSIVVDRHLGLIQHDRIVEALLTDLDLLVFQAVRGLAIRTTPVRTSAVSAESIRILHSLHPKPFAGVTVTQGTDADVTQLSSEETLKLRVPPAASISIELLSMSKPMLSSLLHPTHADTTRSDNTI